MDMIECTTNRFFHRNIMLMTKFSFKKLKREYCEAFYGIPIKC